MQTTDFIRKWWWAAAILIIGTTIGIAVSSERKSADLKTKIAASLGDIAPGSNKAILTLSNGQQVELDSAAAATINDGTLSIQNKNGALNYIHKNGVAVTNTMRTPNGGQYQLVLADGTKVWLNAASSITYPTTFDGATRQIKISGEAYLEIAKDKKRPFLVDVDGKTVVEVLGTSFNINSYGNESTIKTTLVDGSVRVNRDVLLLPGQQALLTVNSSTEASSTSSENPATQITSSQNTPGKAIVVEAADVQQIIAWKNGLFSFNNADLRSVMRQLERWYDIKVRYEGKVSSITISGEMFRNVTLSDVLAFLEASGLKFRMEGKELIIMQVV